MLPLLGSDLWLADPAPLLLWPARHESELTLSMLLRARSKGLPCRGLLSKGLLHEHACLHSRPCRHQAAPSELHQYIPGILGGR